MNDARIVRGDERLGGLDRVAQRDLGRKRAALDDHALEIDPMHVVHGDPGDSAVLARAVHVYDAGMVHDRQRARLPHEARARGVRGDFRRHHLEYDASPVRIACEVQHAHSPLREPALDHVWPDGGARIDGYGGGRAHGAAIVPVGRACG